MYKAAVNSCLLLTTMMVSSLSFAELEVSKAATDDFTAIDGMFDSELDGAFGIDLEIPVVLTAARLRQSKLDAPASVTVIEAETIQALGFKDIEEIFRLVPGMLVAYHSGVGEKAPSVSYHGTNLPEHRRLQVLIDGRSVFKPGLARVEWADIPLAVEDIARIEIIRGPNSAAYGANSYLGVINIMTKHPQSEKGVTVKVTGGMRDVANTYVNISDSVGATEIRWTLGSKQKSGFDVLDDGNDNRDGIEATYTSLSTYTPITSHLNIEWQAGYKTGENEQQEQLDKYVRYSSPEDIQAYDSYLMAKLNYEFSSTQFSHLLVNSSVFERETQWRACLLPGVAGALNIQDVCGDFNQNLKETKTEVEYQHTSMWSNNFRTVSGVRLRLDQLDSETYNDGYSDNYNKSIFTNAEYKLSEDWLLNAGGMYEKDTLNGEYLSPRVAFNYQLTKLDVIRFIYSEAVRAPDLFEKNGQTVYTIKNANLISNNAPVEDQVVEYGTLDSELNFEKIYSHEISYFGLYPRINAQLDLKLFHDDLSGLISESLTHDVPLTNDTRLQHQGFEGQFKIELTEFDKLALSFSYLDSNDDFPSNKKSSGKLTTGAEREDSLTADRSGSLSWIHSFSAHTVLGTAYYHVENWNKYAGGSSGGYTFSRLDMNVSHKIPLTSELALTLQAAMQYRLDDDPLGRDKNNYTDDTFVYGSAQINF